MPNILLITSDQQHYNTLGFNNPHIQTPNLDRIAREGTNFTRAYCNNPVCTPSRATIITGLYAAWHGAWSIGVKLPEDVPTVGQMFHDHGYDTTLVGKAHFQPLKSVPGAESVECMPTLRDLDFWRNFNGAHTPWYGFDHVETARNHTDEALVGQHYAIWMEEKGLSNWEDYFRDYPVSTRSQKHSWTLPEEFHYSTWTAERTIANIERSVANNKPFFLWSSFHDPHPSYLVSEPWASMYDPADMPIGKIQPGELAHMSPPLQMTQCHDADWDQFKDPGGQGNHGYQCHLHEEEDLRKNMAVYYGMISFMDQQIGRILDRLDELGITEDTLLVFTTDHGHYLGQHGLIAKGAFHYDDGIKLPFLTRYPGKIPVGATCDAIQGLVDLAPTLLAASGIDVPGLMQGKSQFDVWQGKADRARDHIIVEFRHQPTKLNLRTYIDDRYKITVYGGHEYGELFDLHSDPGETCNRWDHPDCTDVKAKLFQDFIQAEIAREPTRMPRVSGA